MAEYVCEVTTRCTEYGALTDHERRERIVRCRDCRHAEHFESGLCGPFILCGHFESEGCKAMVEPDGFCKWGEERDADGDS